MKSKERVFHAVLFEIIAMAILIPVSALITGKGTSHLATVAIGLSLFTVIWNYFYNVQFDRWFGSNRELRTLKLRIVNSVGFEGGLIFITVPTMAYFLGISLIEALWLDIGFLVFFFFYAIAFNWLYDQYKPYQIISLKN